MKNLATLEQIQKILPQEFPKYQQATMANNESKIGLLNFYYVSGTIPNEQVVKFQRLIHRLTRGNSFLYLSSNKEEDDTYELKKRI